MHPDHDGATVWLVLEADGLVLDRVRRSLHEAGAQCCAVDSISVFHALRARVDFDGFVVGLPDPDGVDEYKLDARVQPLVVLAPVAAGTPSPVTLAVPHARVLDRRLSDPDALRAALGPLADPAQAQSTPDPVRQAFAGRGLSERQLEVLSRALLGDSAREIAERLFISELTVRNHLHAIYERVGASGRRELQGRFLRTLLD